MVIYDYTDIIQNRVNVLNNVHDDTQIHIE